jgi:hypothetical protein
MPLRRTKRSNGRPRPRWKDGSHELVESTHANESRYDEIALESNQQIEPLVTTPLLFRRSHENHVSTRDRIANAGADARIEESEVNAEVRLALRPYGRSYKAGIRHSAGYGRYVKLRISGDQARIRDLDTSTALDTSSNNSLSILLLLRLSRNSVFAGRSVKSGAGGTPGTHSALRSRLCIPANPPVSKLRLPAEAYSILNLRK